MNEPKVAREVAEAEFERFCEMMAAYADAKNLKNEEDVKSFNEQRERFIGAVMNGSLVVEDDGTAVYTPHSGGAPMRFGEPTAANLIVADRFKRDANMQKQIALLASMSGRTEKEIGALSARDMRVCGALTAGFF